MQELELSIMARGNDPIGDIQPLLDQFQAEQHIHVKVTLLSWEAAWTEIVKTALHGHGPDVSEIGTTWIGNLISMNALRHFEPAELAGLGGAKAFLPSSWQSSSLIGEREVVCAVPWLADTRLIYYRRSLLEKAGLDAADAFSSTGQLMLTLNRLRDNGVGVPWVMPISSHRILHDIASWIWSTGGDFVSADGKRVTFDQPPARAGLKAYFELYRYLVPVARDLDGQQADMLFIQEQAAAMISIPMFFEATRRRHPALVEDWRLALPPGAPFVGGSNLVIWKHTRLEREAFRLIKFLMGKEAQAEYSLRTGLLPVRLDTLASPVYTDDPVQAMLVAALHAGRSFPSIRLWGLVEDKLYRAFIQCWTDLSDFPASDIDALLDQYLTPLAEQLNNMLDVR